MAAFVVGALTVSTVGAQNIVFTNSTSSATPAGPYTIQLRAGQPVTVAPNGDIKAQCELVSGTSRCIGIPSGSGSEDPPTVGAPTVSLSSSAVDNDAATAGVQVATGSSFTISASPSQAVTCLRSATPALGSWDGAVLPGLAGGSVTLSAAGTYTFNLKCFNDAGAGSAAPIIVQAVQGTTTDPDPPVTPGNCSSTNQGSDASQHFFPPTNLAQTGAVITFQQLWATGGYEVGSQLVKIEMAGSQYRSFRFNRNMLNSESFFFEMKGDTSNTGGPRPAEFRYATISPCAGDMRMGNNASSVETEKPGCRVFPAEGTFLYLNFGAPIVNERVCNLDPNTDYYMNVTLEDPRDGFQTGQHCNSGFPGSTCAFRVALFQ